MALDYGWIYIERGEANALQVGCTSCFINEDEEIIVEDLPEENRVSISMGTMTRFLYIKNVWFQTKADAELFLDRMKTFNAAGGMTVELRVNSGAFPGCLFAIYSGKTSMEMLRKSCSQIEKVAYGDGTVFKIARVVLRQVG